MNNSSAGGRDILWMMRRAVSYRYSGLIGGVDPLIWFIDEEVWR